MADTSKKKVTTEDNKSTKDKLMSFIDELLNESKDTPDSTEDNKDTDTDDTTEDNSSTEDGDITDTQKALDEANDTIATLTKDLKESQDKVTKLEKDNAELTEDAKAMKSQSIELALSNKTLIADRIIELESTDAKLEEDAIKERQKELVSMPMKELNSTFDKLKTELATKKDSASGKDITKIDNPGIVSGKENNSTIVDDEGNEVIKDGKATSTKQIDSNKKSSIEDYTQSIVNRISKRQ